MGTRACRHVAVSAGAGGAWLPARPHSCACRGARKTAAQPRCRSQATGGSPAGQSGDQRVTPRRSGAVSSDGRPPSCRAGAGPHSPRSGAGAGVVPSASVTKRRGLVSSSPSARAAFLAARAAKKSRSVTPPSALNLGVRHGARKSPILEPVHADGAAKGIHYTGKLHQHAATRIDSVRRAPRSVAGGMIKEEPLRAPRRHRASTGRLRSRGGARLGVLFRMESQLERYSGRIIHPAQIEHVHVIRDRHALAQFLVDQDHGDAGFGQALDDVVDLARQAQGDHGSRFVEQDQARLERQRAASGHQIFERSSRKYRFML